MGDIGSSIIIRLLEGGAKVLGVDINISAAETKSGWESSVASGDLRFTVANVTKESDVEAYTAEAIKLFERLDIVVLSAGVLPTPISWMECDVSSFDRTLAINTKGGPFVPESALDTSYLYHASANLSVVTVFFGAKYAALAMRPFAEERKKEGGGSIVIISSIAGLRARPTTSYAPSLLNRRKFGP